MTPRVATHIRLGIRSVCPSDQSPRCPHEETLRPYLPIVKFRGVSPRTFAEFHREKITRKGCSAAKREKRAFFLG